MDPSSSSINVNNRLILLTLFISTFSAFSPGILTGLLLIDIGETFASPVGIVAQMRTISNGIGVIGAIFTGAFSVRFRHKSLLMIGLSFVSVSALGCFYAPTLSIFFMAYSLSGLGMAMVSPMTYALVGDLFSVEKRSSAIGIVVAGASLGFVLGAPVISFMEERVGWRLTFIGYVFLLNVIALISARMGLPSGSHRSQRGSSGFFEGFKQVLNNRSAIACLIGVIIARASWQGLAYYSVSFYRSSFQIPTRWAAILFSGLALSFTSGSLLSGRIVNRHGRKRLTIIGVILMGLFTALFTNISLFWISLTLSMAGIFFGGIRLAATSTLSLEQVPDFRGSMMSLNAAAVNIGASLGAFIGGMMLLWYSWNMLGIILGVIGIPAAIVYFLFTVDPIKTRSPP